MKLLITGHRGLLGSACFRRMCKVGTIVHTYNGDLTEPYQFRAYLDRTRPDAIIHCAALVGGVKANRDRPVDFLVQNLKIQSTVIDAAAFYAVPRLIFVGTSCLFPKDAPLPVTEESLLTGPFDSSVEAYAIAKLAGYALCKAYHKQYGFHYSTVCPSNIYGIGDFYGRSAHVVPALIEKLAHSKKTGEPMVVWGDGSAIREFIYCDDAADAIGVILEKWHKPDLISIGSGHSVSIKELVYALLNATKSEGIEVIWDTSQPTGIAKKTFNTSKLSSLGWTPKVSLEEGLKLAYKDFVENPHTRFK